ncbi:MAG: GNAT family N-acetyltransferase [Chloroflexi bacterium]|nr:GNAT family N-acetyltransferase [Chloroflexota bacterium]
MNPTGVSIIPYTPAHYRGVLQFSAQQLRTHHHLDWRQINEWLRDEYHHTMLAFRHQTLIGVLSVSPPHNGTAWLRLVALHDQAPASLFRDLLQTTLAHCATSGIYEIAVLEMEFWLQVLLESSGFRAFDQIVHLIREPAPIEYTPPRDFKIRMVRRHDLRIVETIDHAAFPPLWQMSLTDLEECSTYAVSFTMAVVEKHVVAYQLSTSYSDGIHLARLATWPSAQKRGLGKRLVQHLIAQFPHHSITVNTQSSNLAARRIYENLGFVTQKMPTPVWHLLLQSPVSPLPQFEADSQSEF